MDEQNPKDKEEIADLLIENALLRANASGDSTVSTQATEHPTGTVVFTVPDDEQPTIETANEFAAEDAQLAAESKKEVEKGEVVSEEQKATLEKIREAASEKFTPEEIDNFIQMGKRIASKSVLTAIMEVINEGPTKHGLDKKEAAKLCKLITKMMPHKDSGYTQLEFTEVPHKLNLCLSIVQKGYRTDIDIPDLRYATDLFEQYNFIKALAVAYWKQFSEDYNALFRRICNYRADLNLADLVIDPTNPTALYFDPNSAKRIGIFAYYVDSNNRPFYKRTK